MEVGTTMQWIELSTSIESKSAHHVASVLEKYGQGGAIIEEMGADTDDKKESIIKIYLPHNRSYRRIRFEIEQDLCKLPFLVHLTENRLKQEDWFESLKKDFSIMEIGERFVIKPSWVNQLPPVSDRIIIELDPGAAFGTGWHPTTRLCLINLEKYIHPGNKIFDLGTGTGILAIAAAKLGASSVLALDIDPVAVRAARVNALENKTDGVVLVKRGTLSLRTQNKYRNEFDIVIANITANAISDLAKGLATVLNSGGILIVSGIHAEGLDEVLVSLALADLNLCSIDQEGQWFAVVAGKK
jgi:ribosomal protein L11 methyltransferase